MTLIMYIHSILQLSEYANTLHMPNFIPTDFNIENGVSLLIEKWKLNYACHFTAYSNFFSFSLGSRFPAYLLSYVLP